MSKDGWGVMIRATLRTLADAVTGRPDVTGRTGNVQIVVPPSVQRLGPGRLLIDSGRRVLLDTDLGDSGPDSRAADPLELKFERLRQKVRDFHYTLDTRSDVVLAAWDVMHTLHAVTGLSYTAGAEKARRDGGPDGIEPKKGD